MHCVSKKSSHFVIVHIFVKYYRILKIFLLAPFFGQLAIVWLLNIPPNFNRVATLPCKT